MIIAPGRDADPLTRTVDCSGRALRVDDDYPGEGAHLDVLADGGAFFGVEVGADVVGQDHAFTSASAPHDPEVTGRRLAWRLQDGPRLFTKAH